MFEYLDKNNIRSSLISYFKLIAKCQKEIQSIQQKLVLHPRFQPFALLRRISSCNTGIGIRQLKHYFRKKIGVKRDEGLKMYITKYGLEGDLITYEKFLETLLPYTPNTLRDINETISKQLQTQHLDMTVEQMYHKLILKATQSLYIIRLYQQFIFIKTWQNVQSFMAQDLNEKGKKIDLIIKQESDIIYIRKWMELWVEVDEYEVLNLMRFFGGGTQKNIAKLYNNDVRLSIKCTCECKRKNEHKIQLNQNNYKPFNFKKSVTKLRHHNSNEPTENRRRKQTVKSVKKIHLNNQIR